jgi:exodeoxyribonuclease V gamma subunit
VFDSVIPDLPDVSLLSPQVMTWSIMRLLPDYLHGPNFDVIDKYLVEKSDHLKRLQLSERIADVFDKYSIYRPDMVLRWDEAAEETGQAARWQAELWRGLHKGVAGGHRAAILGDFVKKLLASKNESGKLPQRISVFGIPALPGYHLEVINALASLMDVHFFLLSPTREYWADIVPEKKIDADSSDVLHFEVGNQLLASTGKLGRDFFSMMVNKEYEELQSFNDPGRESLLTCIQSDILNLKTWGMDQKTAVHGKDRSIQVHSCHSPMREAEVLFNNLLEFFETRPGLIPKDIIVMTPDIEAYAPYITAVFSGYEDDKKKIPFSIADRRALSESPVIDVFLKIINLKGGRLRAPEIIDLLDSPAVQGRFGFRPDDMEIVLRWVNETHIHWGIDGAHRERMGLPAFDEGSWKSGIDRLLLGYALRGNEERLFNGVLPYDEIEGNETETLGRLLEFLSRLFSAVDELAGNYTLTKWTTLLESLLARFFVEDQENQREIQTLRATIRDLASKQEISAFTEAVGLDVIRYYLTKGLKDEELSVGFMTGAVTFCEMLPMRSIPFRVVALLGMSGDAYPREYRPVGFDLIARDPQPGDRSLRDEDRYLFLEAILSSRECLYISYVGQSIRDNSEIPPSVLISELIDYVDQGFQSAEGEALRGRIVQKHRLQPFNEAYFSGDQRFFSFSKEDCDAARIQSDREAKPRPFITRSLAKIMVDKKEISITDLKRFFRNPSRYFLNHCLGMYLGEEVIVPEEQEPLYRLNALEGYKLKDWLTSRKMAGHDPKSYFALVKGQGILPPATPGEAQYQEVSRVVDAFAAELRTHTDSVKLPPLDIDLPIDDFRVTGRLENIWKSTLVGYECVEKDKARHHLDVWIDHIALNCARKPQYPQGSVFVRIGSAWFFNPVEDAKAEMKKLLSYFLKGMAEPLRFFPQSSSKYAERFVRGRGQDDSLQAARNDWEGSDFSRGEKEDPYFKLCFDRVDPLDDTFTSIALDVFGPLMRSRDKMNKLK